MDLERIKQINSMIPALQKQGFATNSIEAASQSDAIFKDNEDRFMTAQTPAETAAGSASDQEAAQVSTATATQKATPETLANISALEQKVASLESDLNTVIAKMNEMIGVISKLEQGVSSAPAHQSSKETQQKLPEKKPHARSGHYTSSDVDINKIFYYGNK